MARVEQLKNDVKNAQIICTFGLSLGESDLTWRNEIINWLNTDVDNNLFIYDHGAFTKQCDTTPDRLDEEDDAKEALFDRWNLGKEEYLYNKVHIPCDKKIFDIETAIKNAQASNYIKFKSDLIEDAVRIGQNLIS